MGGLRSSSSHRISPSEEDFRPLLGISSIELDISKSVASEESNQTDGKNESIFLEVAKDR